MSISGHLKDLRKRVFLSLLGITLGAVGGWFLYEPVMDYITAPLMRIQDAGTQINFPTIGAALDLKLRVSIWTGLIISCPWWIYQLGAFIVPGLKRKERLYAFAFGAVGVLLFAGGATTGVWLVPRAVEILQSFVPAGGVSLLQADTYVDFYLRLVILFGVSFLIPEVLVALNFLGVLSARNMLRAWRWAVLVAFIFAAIANPLPSPWPMIMQALILVVLYLIAVLISWINERYRKYGRRLRPAKTPRGPGQGSGSDGGSGQGPGPVPGGGGFNGPAGPGFMGGPGYAPVPANGIPGQSGQGAGVGAPAGGTAMPAATAPLGSAPAHALGAPEPAINTAFAAPGTATPVGDGYTPAPAPMPVASGTVQTPQAPPQVSTIPASYQANVPENEASASTVGERNASRLCGVVVLAGGTAKRMGGVSKPDVVVAGKTLLMRAIDEIRAVAPAAEIVVVAPPQVEIPTGVARVLEDPPFGGPVAGVAAGFDLLRTLPGFRADGLVGLLTCDAPLAPRLYPQLELTCVGAEVGDGVSQPAQFVGGAVPLVNEESPVSDVPLDEAQMEETNGLEKSYVQYLHGVYVAGALAQLFATQVRDRSVRSLFGQLKLASVPDTERITMDVDTWEDAAVLEKRLAEIG
ncbi:twin-arginine translocase subunit TatC [Actinomycetaceae bacterium L2_0104]